MLTMILLPEHSIELWGTKSYGCDLVIGKVAQFHFDEEIYAIGRIDPKC
ncbi:hypothetical protein [Cytobacillus praedii]|nr:hypothetical protein [Cytobacillus praedii]